MADACYRIAGRSRRVRIRSLDYTCSCRAAMWDLPSRRSDPRASTSGAAFAVGVTYRDALCVRHSLEESQPNALPRPPLR